MILYEIKFVVVHAYINYIIFWRKGVRWISAGVKMGQKYTWKKGSRWIPAVRRRGKNMRRDRGEFRRVWGRDKLFEL